jgi:ParB family chromosome partitioning protein
MARENKLKSFVFSEKKEKTSGQSQENQNQLSLEQISLNSFQPRRYFDPEQLNELVESILSVGILEPILVRPRGKEQYEIVAGERRYRGAKLAGLKEIPVVIRELSDREALEIALIENLQRQELNPVEEVEGVLELLGIHVEKTTEEVKNLLYQLKNEREKQSRDNVIPNSPSAKNDSRDNVIPNQKSEIQTVEQVFSQLGKNWYSFTCNRLPLLNLPDDILKVLRKGKIAYTKAKAIATVKDEEERDKLLNEAVKEELSLNQIKEKISQLKKQLTEKKESDSNPKEIVQELSRSLSQSKLWQKDPKKWKKIQGLMAKIKLLLVENEE